MRRFAAQPVARRALKRRRDSERAKREALTRLATRCLGAGVSAFGNHWKRILDTHIAVLSARCAALRAAMRFP